MPIIKNGSLNTKRGKVSVRLSDIGEIVVNTNSQTGVLFRRYQKQYINKSNDEIIGTIDTLGNFAHFLDECCDDNFKFLGIPETVGV